MPRCYRSTWVISLTQLLSQGGLPGGVNPCFEFGRIGQSWSSRGKGHVAVKAGQRPKGLSKSGLFWKKQLFQGGRSSQQVQRGRQSLLGITWRRGHWRPDQSGHWPRGGAVSTLCDPMGSSVLGIFQARILDQVSLSFSRGSSLPRYQTLTSGVSCSGRQVLIWWATR